MQTWLDMLILSLIAVVVSAVFALVRGDYSVTSTYWQLAFYFVVFGLWWWWLNRKKFCRSPRPQ